MCSWKAKNILSNIWNKAKKKTTNKQEIQPPANPKPHHPKATRTQVQKTSSKRQDTSLEGRRRKTVGRWYGRGPSNKMFYNEHLLQCTKPVLNWHHLTWGNKGTAFFKSSYRSMGAEWGRNIQSQPKAVQEGCSSKTRGLKNLLVPLAFQSRNIQDAHQNILSQSRDYASKESHQVQDQPLKTQFWKTCTAPKKHSSPSDTALCESICPERVYSIKKKVLMTAGMANRIPSSPAALERDVYIVILAIYNFNQKNR